MSLSPSFRALTIDQHFPDAEFITFDRFDPDGEVRSYIDAGVDSAHVYAKCHWGYSYYDTRFGLKHPRLGFDMSAEMVPRLKAAGIEAVAYFCYWFETRTSRDHPAWRVVGADGTPAIWRHWHGDVENYRARRWGMVCPGHPEYRAQCLNQIEEIFSTYEYDALFLDIIGEGFNYNLNCHCEHCRVRYRALGIDPDHDRLAMVRAWRDFWADVVREAKERMRTGNPKAVLSLNGGPLRVPWKVLQQVDWPYTEGGENAHNPVILRGCGVPNPQSGIGAGPAAYDDWPADRVRMQTSTVAAHANRTFFFYMTGRDPDGRFAQHKLDFLARINRETREKEPYLIGAEPLPCVAVYHSEATHMEAASRDDEGGSGRRLTSLIDRLRGMSVPCDFVPDWQCNEQVLNAFRMLIVNHQSCLSDDEIAVFSRYVEGGGTLLVAGDCGTRHADASPRDTFPLHNLLGTQCEGTCNTFALNGVTGYVPWVEHPFFRHLRRAEYNLWLDWPMVTAVDAEVIAPVIEPLAVETDDNYVGWFPLAPGKETRFAGLTMRTMGKGRAIYSVSPLTWFVPNPNAKYDVDVQWPTALLRGILGHLGIDPGIRIAGPPAVEAVFHRRDGELIVHLLNRTHAAPGNYAAPVHGVEIHVDRDLAEVSHARQGYPLEEELPLQPADAGVCIPVPPVDMHSIIVLN